MKKILLLGAGFSANFGGFLARQIGEMIFNDPVINASYNLRDRLRSNIYNFEKVYSEILFDPESIFSEEEKDSLKKTVKTVYIKQNELIDKYIRDDKKKGEINDTKKFIQKFNHVFTLNQDLLIENHLAQDLEIYGIESDQSGQKKIRQTLPTIDENRKYYFKLHGSSDWIENDDQLLLIGDLKTKIIEKKPIFKNMLDFFTKMINNKKCKIMVVGLNCSGNNDIHIINELKESRNLHFINPDNNNYINDSSCTRGIYPVEFTKIFLPPYSEIVEKNFFSSTS